MQTAVSWIIGELTNLGYIIAPSFGHSIIDEKIEQAKQMEKEQIIESFKHGELPPLFSNLSAEQYYNQTYGK